MTVTKKERLLSLDIFRGIAILLMILVNNPGSWSHIYSPLEHSKWNGCTPTDLVFPFFLFIVGVTTAFSLGKIKEEKHELKPAIIRLVRRSATLFFLGLLLGGFPHYDLSHIRIPGVLQRIAVVYFFTGLLFLKMKKEHLVYLLSFLLLLYWGLMTLIPVPGIGYANLEPTTNLAAWLDRTIMGNHLWSGTKVWDPEGILSTIPAIGTALLGVLTGYWLKSDSDKTTKTVWMFFYGVTLMALGYIWDLWFPINKGIWTSSYVIYTGGLALVFLAFCYWLIDVQDKKWWIKPFHIYGTNAIAVFFLSGLMGRLLYLIKVESPSGETVTLKTYIYQEVFLPFFRPINASLMYAITFILLWLFLMWLLYRKNIFIKV